MTRPTSLSRSPLELVDYALSVRHKLENRTFVAFIALCRFDPYPHERVPWEKVGQLFNASSRSYVSQVLRAMKGADIVDYEGGVPSDPGYLFFRIGPK